MTKILRIDPEANDYLWWKLVEFVDSLWNPLSSDNIHNFTLNQLHSVLEWENPVQGIWSIASTDEPLVLPEMSFKEIHDTVTWRVFDTIRDTCPSIDPINASTVSTILSNRFFNQPVIDHATDLAWIRYTSNGKAYTVDVKAGRVNTTFSAPFWKGTSQATALTVALDKRAEVKEMQKRYKTLKWLERDGIVECTEDGQFRIKWVYTKHHPKHHTPRVWIHLPDGKNVGRSMEKNDRAFKIWFKRILEVLFWFHTRLTYGQKEALKTLGDENLYENRDRKCAWREQIREQIREQRLEQGLEVLLWMELIEEAWEGQYRFKWVVVDMERQEIQIRWNRKILKTSFTEISFEEAYKVFVKQYVLNTKLQLKIAPKEALKSLSKQSLYKTGSLRKK